MAVVKLNSLETKEFGAPESPVRGSLHRGSTGHSNAPERIAPGRVCGLWGSGYSAATRSAAARQLCSASRKAVIQ